MKFVLISVSRFYNVVLKLLCGLVMSAFSYRLTLNWSKKHQEGILNASAGRTVQKPANLCFSLCAGALPEDHREVWVPGAALGAIHHTEWRLPAQDKLSSLNNLWWRYWLLFIVLCTLEFVYRICDEMAGRVWEWMNERVWRHGQDLQSLARNLFFFQNLSRCCKGNFSCPCQSINLRVVCVCTVQLWAVHFTTIFPSLLMSSYFS